MAEPTTFPEEHVHEPLVYRRISGLALAGLILAGFFTVYLLISAALAWWARTPVLLPWVVQALVLVAAALSALGLLMIQRSEGTLTGRKIALTGWWLSVVMGLGYWAYYAATYFAVCQQAETFSTRWLQRVCEDKLNRAFLDTQDPAQRLSVNPENEMELEMKFRAVLGPQSASSNKTVLEIFRTNPIVQALVQGGPDAKFESEGVRDWEYTTGGYKVKQTFRVANPDAIHTVQVTVLGKESKSRPPEFEGRQWQIVWGPETNLVKSEYTAQGKKMGQLRRQATIFADEWGNKLTRRDLLGAYLDTLPPADRPRTRTEYAVREAAALLASASTASNALVQLGICGGDTGRCLFLPGYYQTFRRGGLLTTDKFKADDDKARDIVLSSTRALFGAPVPGGRMLHMQVSMISNRVPGKDDKGHLRLAHDYMMGFMTGHASGFMGEGTLFIEADRSDPDPNQDVGWRIVGLELASGSDRTAARNQPGGAPMPGAGGTPMPGGNRPPPGMMPPGG